MSDEVVNTCLGLYTEYAVDTLEQVWRSLLKVYNDTYAAHFLNVEHTWGSDATEDWDIGGGGRL